MRAFLPSPLITFLLFYLSNNFLSILIFSVRVQPGGGGLEPPAIVEFVLAIVSLVQNVLSPLLAGVGIINRIERTGIGTETENQTQR
jgi:hypothetical protein